MVLNMIPVNACREYRSEYAALTQVMARDDSPSEWSAMLAALAII